jgi:hypothetical protein
MDWFADLVSVNDNIESKRRRAQLRSSGCAKQENVAAQFGALNSWLASMLDVQCCTQRDRPAYMTPMGKPPVKQVPDSGRSSTSTMSEASDIWKGDAFHHESDVRSHKFDKELDGQRLHSPLHVPHGLVDKIAHLVNSNPYIAREIGERGSRSLRFQFLKQCSRRRHAQCEDIWSTLDEHDRLDFMQVFHLKGKNPDCFFLNLVEPDARIAKEEWSEYSPSEFETRSDSGPSTSTKSSQSSCHGY